MSFKFDWSRISTNKELRDQLRDKINSALRKGLSESENYAVVLRHLDFGSEPPELQIVKISELKFDKVHLIFSFAYRGDAFMSFDVNLQVNPLVSDKGRIGHLSRTHMGTLSSHLPLPASIDTTLSKFEIDGTLELSIDVPHLSQEQEQIEMNKEKMTESETELTITPMEETSSILTKSTEAIKQRLRAISSTSREKEENLKQQSSEVIKPKQTEGTTVSLLLLNEAFRDVRVNSSFDGSNASRKIAKTLKKHIRNGLKKLVGTPQVFTFSTSSLVSSSKSTPTSS